MTTVNIPSAGDQELPQEAVTTERMKQVVGGLLVPSQALAKAMARRIINLEAGRPVDAPIPL